METQVPTALLMDCLASLALLENHHTATLTVGPTALSPSPDPLPQQCLGRALSIVCSKYICKSVSSYDTTSITTACLRPRKDPWLLAVFFLRPRKKKVARDPGAVTLSSPFMTLVLLKVATA
jgi:hypothetical protein